ncbi:MAG: F0F1 ATP synthase subunit A, partial [Planctomycetota bacterium]|nr:F0F1 ATP synthase subunit A [Planctomycetota bacterium]
GFQAGAFRRAPQKALETLVQGFLVKLVVLAGMCLTVRYWEVLGSRLDWQAFTLAATCGVFLLLLLGTWDNAPILREDRLVNFLRLLLMAAVVFGSCFLTTKYSEHHAASNDNAFVGLYMHLMPAPLLASHGEHGMEEGHTIDDGHDHGSDTKDYLFAPSFPLMPAIMDGAPDKEGTNLVLTNLQIFQVASILMILLAFSGVPGYLRTGRGDWLTRVLTGWILYIRDEMVIPNLGADDGRRFLPFFCSIFFFIVFINLMGLVPGSVTPTTNVFVTMALALITFTSMLGLGMAAQGPVAFWKNLVPHVPIVMWPMMFVIEVVGLIIKPFALMIRLFANMTGGHMVVLSFMGLIFFAAGTDVNSMAWGISVPAVGFGVFIMIIEGFVALLQAYIFTQLSCLFVGACLHPDH